MDFFFFLTRTQFFISSFLAFEVLLDDILGLRLFAKALDKRQAHLCVLASNCDEPMYSKLVEALGAEDQINLIKVDGNKKLGEWVGLCKTERENPIKVAGCSCVAVKNYGKESQAKDVIEEYFKMQEIMK